MKKIREFRNYLFVRKAFRKARDRDSEWKKYKLRMNWFGVVYTTVSLREQDMGEEESVQRFKAMMMMQPINDYISSLGAKEDGMGIQELIYPEINSVPGTRSYYISYTPKLDEITPMWIITRLLMLGIIAAAIATIFTNPQILKNLFG